MLRISEQELPNLLTLITAFMLDRSSDFKSFGELVEIFERSYKDSNFKDESNDLRILDYERNMAGGKWTEPIVLLRDRNTNIIRDGIHRGVAYLRCLNKKIDKKLLPDIYIIDMVFAFD